MAKQISGKDARQGRQGSRVLLVLVGALILVALAWGIAEFYGESIDHTAPADGTTTQGQAPQG